MIYSVGGIMMHKDRDGNMLMHSAKGHEWDQHKYVDKVKGKDGKWHYIYNTSKSPVSPTTKEIQQMKEEGIEFDYSAVNGNGTSKAKLPEVKDEDIEQAESAIKDMLLFYGSGNKNYLSRKALNALKKVLERALSGEMKTKETGERAKSSRRV